MKPEETEDGVTQGYVKTFNGVKRYGFIIAQEIPRDIFFHASIFTQREIRAGDEVTFGYRQMEDGRYRATRIIVGEED